MGGLLTAHMLLISDAKIETIFETTKEPKKKKFFGSFLNEQSINLF